MQSIKAITATGPSQVDLGAFTEGFASWQRAIAGAKPEAKIIVFTNAARDVAHFVRCGLDIATATDALHNIAVANGLPGLHGEDAVQAALAEGFASHDDQIADGGRKNLAAGTPAPTNAGERPGALKVARIILTYFGDCGAFVQKRSILKGIIATGETSAWIGPPGAGKSALQTEIAVHCAAQRDWRGHKAKEACGVLILALERADLYRRRMHAYRLRDGLHDLPIAVAGTIIDLLDHRCVDLIVATVREAEEHFGTSVGLIIIDTYAKGIAANGGDEDKARDQNRAAANLRKVHSLLDVHVSLVGHTGKDETRGARGSNAHVGDVDLMIQISGDAVKSATIVKANDQAERVIAQFTIDTFELGRDEDGDPITTAILSADHVEAPITGKKEKLTLNQQAALRALFEVIADGETSPRPDDMHVPVGVTGVTLAKWKHRLMKLGIINSEGSYREQFKRLHVTLKDLGFIGVWDGFVWPVT